MDTIQPHPQVRFFDRDAIVDFYLLLALVNVAVGLLKISFGIVGALAPSLRVVMTIAAAGALLTMGSIK